MSPEKRSAVMSRIRGKGTLPERLVMGRLQALGFVWESHQRDLPGCPDIVFRDARVAVFIDGDFWHGWRFPVWRDKLSEAWELKIEQTRKRDAKNHRRLLKLGWQVLRIWEHQIDANLDKCLQRVQEALRGSSLNGVG